MFWCSPLGASAKPQAAQSGLHPVLQIVRILPLLARVHGRTAMRVTLISHNAQAGDAIGNQVAARAAFFRERGAEVRVLLESDRRLHPSLRSLARVAECSDA